MGVRIEPHGRRLVVQDAIRIVPDGGPDDHPSNVGSRVRMRVDTSPPSVSACPPQGRLTADEEW